MPRVLTARDGELFFTAGATADDRELWKSDGTPGGTDEVVDINPAGSGQPQSLRNANGILFFNANDGGTFGRELWMSDGTTATRLTDIDPGADSGVFSSDNAVVGRSYLFAASNPDTFSLEPYAAFVEGPSEAEPEPEPAPRCGGKSATIVGTAGRNVLRGTPGRDVVAGLGGRDRLIGRGGRDILCGGNGPDRLLGGKGRDRLIGGKGRDRLRGGPGRDVLRGGPGRDLQRQ